MCYEQSLINTIFALICFTIGIVRFDVVGFAGMPVEDELGSPISPGRVGFSLDVVLRPIAQTPST
jgi:hypothetical protein